MTRFRHSCGQRKNFSRRSGQVGGYQKFPRHKLNGRVLRVTDGDSLTANVGEFGEVNIRLAYVDAPEHDQPWGNQATGALRALLKGADVQFRLRYRDQYARAIAEVWIGNRSVNEEMVRLGHAWTYERYVPSARKSYYRNLMKKAKESRVGLWKAPAPTPPWEWRKTKTETSSGYERTGVAPKVLPGPTPRPAIRIGWVVVILLVSVLVLIVQGGN